MSRNDETRIQDLLHMKEQLLHGGEAILHIEQAGPSPSQPATKFTGQKLG